MFVGSGGAAERVDCDDGVSGSGDVENLLRFGRDGVERSVVAEEGHALRAEGDEQRADVPRAENAFGDELEIVVVFHRRHGVVTVESGEPESFGAVRGHDREPLNFHRMPRVRIKGGDDSVFAGDVGESLDGVAVEQPFVVIFKNDGVDFVFADELCEPGFHFRRDFFGDGEDVFEIDADDLLVCGHDAHFFGGSAAVGEDIGFVDMVVGEEFAEFVAGGVVSDDSECDGFCAEGCDVAHDVCRAAGSAFCAFDLQDGDGGLLGHAVGGADEIDVHHEIAENGDGHVFRTVQNFFNTFAGESHDRDP